MLTFVSDCGYCRARTQTFDVISRDQKDGDWSEPLYVLGIRCRRCKLISCVEAHARNASSRAPLENADVTRLYRVLRQRPELVEPKAPQHVPEVVARAFVQAEKQVDDPSMSESAAVMYRRTVEQALTSVAAARQVPLPGNNLKARIDAAALAKLIPIDLAEWAHDVREIGNEGAHGPSVSQAELKELRGFVDLLLRYLFSLPGLMEDRRLKNTAP